TPSGGDVGASPRSGRGLRGRVGLVQGAGQASPGGQVPEPRNRRGRRGRERPPAPRRALPGAPAGRQAPPPGRRDGLGPYVRDEGPPDDGDVERAAVLPQLLLRDDRERHGREARRGRRGGRRRRRRGGSPVAK
ncbi:hypothetical protein THAOC_06781, partial [Thalassiosira oceanica]